MNKLISEQDSQQLAFTNIYKYWMKTGHFLLLLLLINGFHTLIKWHVNMNGLKCYSNKIWMYFYEKL